eukprot:CFRG4972T1
MFIRAILATCITAFLLLFSISEDLSDPAIYDRKAQGIRHKVFLGEKKWRPMSRSVHSNFVSLSMEYSARSIYYAFAFPETSAKIENLLAILKVKDGGRPLYFRLGGNSVMKLLYENTKLQYPEHIYISKIVGDRTLSHLRQFGERSGAHFIMALPMMDPDPKYAVEFGEAIMNVFNGTDMVYAIELGNEPDHWGDTKPDKVNLLENRPKFSFKDGYRMHFNDYIAEVCNQYLIAINKSPTLRRLNIQGPAIAGTNTNLWPSWTNSLYPFFTQTSEKTNKRVITTFHRYGMSGYNEFASIELFMSDPLNDGTTKSRNTMEWVGKIATQVLDNGGEFVHGEGSTVTGSGRGVLTKLRGLDRSYPAGVWTLNNLFEYASRNVTRSHVHGLCGSSFSPIYVPYLSYDKGTEHYLKLLVTPIYGAMYFFNRLLDGGKDAVRISVPSAYIGTSTEKNPSISDPKAISPYYKHYYLQNNATGRNSLLYIHKDPTASAKPLNAEIDAKFCRAGTELQLERFTPVQRSRIMDNSYDQYTANLNGIWFDDQGKQFGKYIVESSPYDSLANVWRVDIDPLTAVAVHCNHQ